MYKATLSYLVGQNQVIGFHTLHYRTFPCAIILQTNNATLLSQLFKSFFYQYCKIIFIADRHGALEPVQSRSRLRPRVRSDKR